jgi:Na+-translocating ferredoxin:NAD+ oxidoreductase RnfG subunit
MSAEARSFYARLIHFCRLALIVAIAWLVTERASKWAESGSGERMDAILSEMADEGNAWLTSPEGDEVMGWAGPTTLVLIPDGLDQVAFPLILRSADSASYVARVADHPEFLPSLFGLELHELGDWQVDAVSGATLTSRAIIGAVRRKFGGVSPPGPFPLMLLESKEPGNWTLQGVAVADAGYQGPTQVVLEFGADDRLIRLVLSESFDNDPYVSDVRLDSSFLRTFTGRSLEELAGLEVGRSGVEGVSGATMTSQGIARTVRATAEKELVLRNEGRTTVEPLALARSPRELLGWMVGGVALLVLITPLRRRRAARKLLRIGVVLGFGMGAGALLSLDAAWSWAQHGLPWQSAPLLAGFVVAAILGPAFFGRKAYCRSLCAHGALQQLLAPRARGRVAPKLDALFRRLPGTLLTAAILLPVLTQASSSSGIELASWEPFAAWTPQSAAMASLILAGLSLLASAWVPLAYCHYACPTGALLEYLRHRPQQILRRGDFVAFALLVSALASR